MLEASAGLKSAWWRTVIPYSVSVPSTLWMAMVRPTPSRAFRLRPHRYCPVATASMAAALVLAGDQGPDVDDALALLARDLRPVVGVGGVGQVLVLPELLLDGGEEVVARSSRRRRRRSDA